jgi:hypothetical protein
LTFEYNEYIFISKLPKEVKTMPGFNGTGPTGRGPRTGRGFGPCAMPAGRQGLGLGWGRRFTAGRGLGRYFGWNYPETKEEQKQALAEYQKALEEELEDVRKEEAEIDKTK